MRGKIVGGAALLVAAFLIGWLGFRNAASPMRDDEESRYQKLVSDAASASREYLDWFEKDSERIAPDRLPDVVQEVRKYADHVGRARIALDRGEPPQSMAPFAERFDAAFEHVVTSCRAFARLPEGGVEDVVMTMYGGLEEAALAEEGFYHLRSDLPEFSDFWPSRPTKRVESASEGSPSMPRGIVHMGAGGRHGGFTLYVPEDYTPGKRWPMLVALHGAGSNGRHFIWTWMREATRRGYIVLAPNSQRPPTWSIEDDEGLLEIIGWVESQYEIATDRVLITGFSDGGSFSIVFGLMHPKAFRALAPVSGAFLPMNETAGNLPRARGVPIYLVHGATDFIFPVANAHDTRDTLVSAGAAVKYRELADRSHVYPRSENPRILDWFEALPNRAS